nr:AraC family transcriptional regulator [uncultured Blautia sp.]
MDYSQYSLAKTGYLKEDFRLFHINDRTDREFEWHYHDFHKIIVFVSGKVTYHIEGKAYQFKPQDILLVSQGAIHKPEIDPSIPYERYIFWIRDDLSSSELNTCFQKANDRSFNLIRLDSVLQEKLKDLLPEIEHSLRDTQFGDSILSKALFAQFMVYINRIFLKSSTAPDQKSYSSDSQVEQLLKYINRNLSENLSIDHLAERFFFSKYHMMRKFKKETGYTIHNYIISKRLLHARSLIAQGTPVMKAAMQSGFQDYTAFVRAYKKQFGTVPTQR